MNNRFGYEWSQYREIIPLYETQFLAWTSPVAVADWKNKDVLDAGCGTGRNSYWPLKYGAKSVVSFDVDPRTVNVARQNLAQFENCDVTQVSIYDLPWRDKFDLVFSIGVIHHLAEPKRAISNLVSATKPGGRILIWVYGKEGYTALKVLVNSIRRVTCRISPALLKIIVYPFSFLWWLYMRLPHRHPYMRQFKSAKLWHVHSILFDQLLPDIANYWTKDEAVSLFEGLPVDHVEAVWINKGSWTVVATRKQDAL